MIPDARSPSSLIFMSPVFKMLSCTLLMGLMKPEATEFFRRQYNNQFPVGGRRSRFLSFSFFFSFNLNFELPGGAGCGPSSPEPGGRHESLRPRGVLSTVKLIWVGVTCHPMKPHWADGRVHEQRTSPTRLMRSSNDTEILSCELGIATPFSLACCRRYSVLIWSCVWPWQPVRTVLEQFECCAAHETFT